MTKFESEILAKLKKMPEFANIDFIILFGSQAEGKSNKNSDYDFAVYYNGNKSERYDFRLKILSILPEKFDIQIFQDLPLYIQKDVIKGKLVYAKDLNQVYEIAYSTVKKFEDFKKYYYDYIGLEQIK